MTQDRSKSLKYCLKSNSFVFIYFFKLITGWWGMAKERLSSMFEPGPEDESPYNLANVYGLTPQSQQMPGINTPGSTQTTQQDGQQQRQYQLQQQQLGRNVPPPGQLRYPPQYTGRPEYQSQPGYPSQTHQQGQQQGQQQFQQNRGQQFQQPPARLPPGYTPPQPRSDVAYPMQQQQPQFVNRPGQSGPPLQGQWRGGPPPGRGFSSPQQQQQQQQLPQSQFDPQSNSPRDGSLPQTVVPTSQQNQQKQDTPPQKNQEWFDHPGLAGGF
jgi:PAX-interacting protein 1